MLCRPYEATEFCDTEFCDTLVPGVPISQGDWLRNEPDTRGKAWPVSQAKCDFDPWHLGSTATKSILKEKKIHVVKQFEVVTWENIASSREGITS